MSALLVRPSQPATVFIIKDHSQSFTRDVLGKSIRLPCWPARINDAHIDVEVELGAWQSNGEKIFSGRLRSRGLACLMGISSAPAPLLKSIEQTSLATFPFPLEVDRRDASLLCASRLADRQHSLCYGWFGMLQQAIKRLLVSLEGPGRCLVLLFTLPCRSHTDDGDWDNEISWLTSTQVVPTTISFQPRSSFLPNR